LEFLIIRYTNAEIASFIYIAGKNFRRIQEGPGRSLKNGLVSIMSRYVFLVPPKIPGVDESAL
jgi:hypothetical protein